MARPEFPTVNGADTTWADLTLAFMIMTGPVFRTGDFSALKVKETVEPGEKRGAGSVARGRGVGTYKVEASFTMYLQAHLRFMAAIALVAKSQQIPPTLVQFEISGFYKTPGAPKTSIRVPQCTITERGLDTSQGNEVIAVETPVWASRAFFNGVSLIEIPL
jgi:hypothetical protein